jgi:hypothetical protein
MPLTRMPGGDLGISLDALQMPRVQPFALGGVIGGSVAGPGAGIGAGAGTSPVPVKIDVGVWLNGERTEGKVETRDSPGGMSVDVMLDQIEARLASNTRRGTGTLGRAMADTFGLHRRGR